MQYRHGRGLSAPPPTQAPMPTSKILPKHLNIILSKIATYHLLSVAGHYSLPRREIFGSKDRRSDNQRNVRSIDISRLQVVLALISYEHLIRREVGIFVDSEPVLQRSHRLSAQRERVRNLPARINVHQWPPGDGRLKDRGDLRARHDEVRRTTQRLLVDG